MSNLIYIISLALSKGTFSTRQALRLWSKA